MWQKCWIFFILEPDLHITFSEGGSVNSKWPVAVNNRNQVWNRRTRLIQCNCEYEMHNGKTPT